MARAHRCRRSRRIGTVEIGYIDRPRRTRTQRVWRFTDHTTTEIASLEGLAKHRIGLDFILGGLRDCGTGPEIITFNANRLTILDTRLPDGTLTARDSGLLPLPASRRQVLCALGFCAHLAENNLSPHHSHAVRTE